MKALEGVGDASLGEWEEVTEKAYHVRRRLTAEEQAGVGDACDIRGTAEAEERLQRSWKLVESLPAEHSRLRQTGDTARIESYAAEGIGTFGRRELAR